MQNDVDRDETFALPRWPVYGPEEIAAVSAVLESGRVNYWTGDQGRQFEKEFAACTGTQHAVALANGSVALDTALRVLGVGAGDEVVVTPRSFFASAACVALAGATPAFADVDRISQNITASSIEKALTKRTKAVICVHHAGWPCEMEEIRRLADRRGLFVIEDCAQAHGAAIGDKPVGAWGHIGTFSFCQDKIMSTGGEGGMLVTNDDALWHKAWSLKDHGKSHTLANAPPQAPGFRWLHQSFGTNYRMTEIQAAIGRIQLQKLDEWVAARQRNATLLNDRLEALNCVRLVRPPEHIRCSYYKHYFFVEPAKLRNDWTRDRILAELEKGGVPGLSGSCPEIYREEAFVNSRHAVAGGLPVARELGETSVQLLVHPTLSENDIDQVANIVSAVLTRASARQG